MDPEIDEFLERVIGASPGLTSVWLIGSRANATAIVGSDWDFIAFGTQATLEFLRTATHLHDEKTDFLVVTNGEDFQAAWGETDKTGSLSEWKWNELSDTEATYVQSKWMERDDGSRVELTDRRAILAWRRRDNEL
jgi:hypothetical protein